VEKPEEKNVMHLVAESAFFKFTVPQPGSFGRAAKYRILHRK